jgi:hypothetical protein
MWNLNTQFATNDNVLLLEDDVIIKDGFFGEYELALDSFSNKDFKIFTINQSFSAFSVNKLELISTNWFDERFLGLGHEDGEYNNRYRNRSGLCLIYNNFVKIDSCVNNESMGDDGKKILNLVENEVRLEGQRLCNQFNRYSEFNREVRDSDYIKNSSIQYPYEKFYLENRYKL